MSKSHTKLLFSLQFIFLYIFGLFFSLRTPVADDWIYLKLASHKEGILGRDTFELINGHQQVLVKLYVWALGCLPTTYFTFFWAFNILLVVLGGYLLLSSQIRVAYGSISSKWFLAIFVLLTNFKAMYLYFSITGLGLCMAYFLIGLYFYLHNSAEISNVVFKKNIVAFLAAFTTGFGLALTLYHLLVSITELILRKRNSLNGLIWSILAIFFAYILPSFFQLFNLRSPGHTKDFLVSLIDLLQNPISSIAFFFGLIGSIFSSNSRFDPNFPIAIGLCISLAFLGLYALLKRNFFRRDYLNIISRTPLLPAFIFMSMLIIFRGKGEVDSLIEAAAPRYVIGSSLFVVGIISFIAHSKLVKESFASRILSLFLVAAMFFSLIGLKTGLEWGNVRSSQSHQLYQCLIDNIDTKPCMPIAEQIKEGDSSLHEIQQDLLHLKSYLNS